MKSPVRIFGGLHIVYGVVVLLGAYSPLSPGQKGGPIWDLLGDLSKALVLFSGALGISEIWGAVGVLRFRNAGRICLLTTSGMWLLVAAVLNNAAEWDHPHGGVVFGNLTIALLHGLTIWYFLRPSVKAQFISKTANR